MEHEFSDAIRTPTQVAKRALALFGVIAVAFGAEREEIIAWLRANDLYDELSPIEAEFIDDPAPSEHQVVNAGWYSERLIVLAWALGLVSMPSATEQCDTTLLQEVLPPYAKIEEDQFIRTSRLRSDEELIAAADNILNAHWEARDAATHNRPSRFGVDLEIIQERHHAINWVIGYDSLPWDEVTTDT